MKMTIQRLTALALVFSFAGALEAQVTPAQQQQQRQQQALQQQLANRQSRDVLAKVNGDEITKTELDVALQSQVEGRQVDPSTMQQLRQQTLDSLIKSRLVEQYLMEEGPEVESQEIKTVIEGAKKQLEAQGVNYKEFVAERGHTPETFEKRIEGSLAWQKYQQSKLSEEKLQQHFQNNKERFPVENYEQARPLVQQSYTAKLWNDLVELASDDAEIEVVKPRAVQPPGAAQPQNQRGNGGATPIQPQQ